MSFTWRDAINAAFATFALAGLIVIVAMGLWPTAGHGRVAYPGQYAQYSPEERRWFRNQTSPATGGNCCNEADGVYAEEDIRQGHYWTNFHFRPWVGGIQVDR